GVSYGEGEGSFEEGRRLWIQEVAPALALGRREAFVRAGAVVLVPGKEVPGKVAPERVVPGLGAFAQEGAPVRGAPVLEVLGRAASVQTLAAFPVPVLEAPGQEAPVASSPFVPAAKPVDLLGLLLVVIL